MKNVLITLLCGASAYVSTAQTGINWWLTKGDQSVLLKKQAVIPFNNSPTDGSTITVDTLRKYQLVDGFGFALTGSSAFLISKMDNAARAALLNELFADGSGNGIGVSTLRISIGSSDLSPSVYFYDDVPAGQTDADLTHFDLGHDKEYLIPVLQQIIKIAPRIKIIATPWSAPTWMKTSGNSIGGTLKPEYYKAYANYFVKYITAMREAGITLDAITPQNEPLNDHNNPSMSFPAQQEGAFIKNCLWPAFRAAGLKTKIIIYDHNCDNTDYAKSILKDPELRAYIAGSAFHLYTGNISAMLELHNAFPDRNVYFTEQYTDIKGDFGGDLRWHVKNLVTGAMRNWSRNVIEWNLANDPSYGPHTAGGCSVCKGAITISGSAVKRNVSYYIIAHASKFVPAGSVRVWSDNTNNLNTVAFRTPDHRVVLVVENEATSDESFSIRYADKSARCTIPGGSVATYEW